MTRRALAAPGVVRRARPARTTSARSPVLRSGGPVHTVFARDGRPQAADLVALQRLAGNRAVELAVTRTTEVVGHGDCSGPELECSAKASRTSSKSISVPAPKKKKKKKGEEADPDSWTGKGTLTATFATTVSITLATPPSGMSKCATGKYKAMIKNELKPHEEDHKKRFKTKDPDHSYNGTVKKKLEETGDDPVTIQDSIKQQLSDAFDTELSDRETRNEAWAITAIDPFNVTADISDCPECNPEEDTG